MMSHHLAFLECMSGGSAVPTIQESLYVHWADGSVEAIEGAEWWMQAWRRWRPPGADLHPWEIDRAEIVLCVQPHHTVLCLSCHRAYLETCCKVWQPLLWNCGSLGIHSLFAFPPPYPLPASHFLDFCFLEFAPLLSRVLACKLLP